MSIDNSIPLATVLEIGGQVWVRSTDGKQHLLRKGETVYQGDIIITAEGGYASVQSLNGSILDITGGKEILLSADHFQAGSDPEKEKNFGNAHESFPHVEGKTIKKAAEKTDSESSGIHGFLRVRRISGTDSHSPYSFSSFTGNYESSQGNRSSGDNPFLEGRATMDERIVIPVSSSDSLSTRDVTGSPL
ncbi:MAG: hypothetical protein FDX30_04200, partial [Chlorobium sp.]